MKKNRCDWVKDDEIYIKYHDEEWGKPVHDDRKLFEFLILEGMQAGLSWITVLKKRENFKVAFDNFDVDLVSNYDEEKIQELLNNEGIIRNKLKVRGAVKNARAFKRVQEEFGSFDSYVWGFVDGKTIKGDWDSIDDVPANTPLSDEISKDLKKRGFTFVGSTIIYSFMQAVGIVNDHTNSCDFL